MRILPHEMRKILMGSLWLDWERSSDFTSQPSHEACRFLMHVYLATTAVEYIHEYILNLVPTDVYVGTCTTTKFSMLLRPSHGHDHGLAVHTIMEACCAHSSTTWVLLNRLVDLYCTQPPKIPKFCSRYHTILILISLLQKGKVR